MFFNMAVTQASSPLEDARTCVKNYYDSQCFVREESNRNDGSEITGYFHYIGIKYLDHASADKRRWCGAFQANAWGHCGISIPFVKTMAALASVDAWSRAKIYQVTINKADTGDIVSYKFRHVEGIYERHPNPSFPYFTACGGNTSAPRAYRHERDGVWKKVRMWREVARVISLEKVLEGAS